MSRVATTCQPRRRTLLLASVGWAGAVAAQGSAWRPTRPIRLVVAYPPGGVSDAVARVLAERLAEQMAIPVRVENRPGAGGSLAMEVLARSGPDEDVLCLSAVTTLALMRSAPALQSGALPVTPVAAVMRTPVLVVGTSSLPANSFGDMLAEAKRRPLRWATTGEGTTGHRVLELIQRDSGGVFVHVPYKGGGQQIADALGGHFEVLSTNVAAAQIRFVRAGKLKALAVGAPSRLPVLAQVPTLAELGFERANLSSVFGVFAPPRAPQARVARLNTEINAALSHPRLRSELLEMNNMAVGGSARAFAELIQREGGS